MSIEITGPNIIQILMHPNKTAVMLCDVAMVFLLESKKLSECNCLSRATCALEELVGLQSVHSGFHVVY